MNILLTGTTGFVGANLLIKLLELKIPVAILLRHNSNISRIQSYLNQVTVIKISDNNSNEVIHQLKMFAPDVLIHLAWKGVENYYRNDYAQIHDNLSYITTLFEIIDHLNIKKIIAFGSQAEYGICNECISETQTANPTSLYGAAKLAALAAFNTYCSQKSIAFVWARLFSIYGKMDNSTWLIPMLITKLMRNEAPLLTEGKQHWDFLYIDDAIDAIIHLLKSDKASGVFNIGSGEAVTIRTVCEITRDLINPRMDLKFGAVPYRTDQVTFLQANIDRIKHEIKWSPRIPLIEGITKTIEWHQKNNVIIEHAST